MDVATADPDVFLLNQSGTFAGDSTCHGTTDVSVNADTIFEAGIGFFNSAGNDGHTSASDCTVGPPGSAIGVFAVGAIGVDDPPGNQENLYNGTARGGTTTEPGNGRTIVGAIGPTGHTLRAEDDVNANPLYTTGNFCCTSGSAPAVTGAAALFRQWYLDTQSSQIDDPGLLYVSLLLMGDRRVEGLSPTYATVGFDSIWGAGELRLRMLDSAGLDAPYGWGIGSVCVDAGQNVYLDLGGGGLFTGSMDYIKAVTWWYDAEYDTSTTAGFDKFDLKLQRRPTVNDSWTTQVTSSSDDNRQRVFQGSDVPGYYYRLKIVGRDVSSDNSGCGVDSNRVYYGWMYEDNARDDDADLATYVRPEVL